MATTPANFAAKGKTTLLAMSTVETVPFREFRAVIRPIAGPEHEGPTPASKDAAIANVVSAFRDAAENAATNFPAQCMGIGRDLVSYSVEERADFRR